MNSKPLRRVHDDPVGGEVITPSRWRKKSLDHVVGDVLLHNLALLQRIGVGIWAPPIVEDLERNERIYRDLLRVTREQITVLEAFSTIEWGESG